MHRLAHLFNCSNRNRGILRMNFDEAALLYGYARESCGNVLEIGRRFGGSLALLHDATQPHQHLYSIDLADEIHPRLDYLRDDPRVHILVGDSGCSQLVDRLSLLLVDGDHTEQGVQRDLARHWDSLMVGGVALFHDACPNDGLGPRHNNHHGGVTACVQHLLDSLDARSLGTAGSMWAVAKTA